MSNLHTSSDDGYPDEVSINSPSHDYRDGLSKSGSQFDEGSEFNQIDVEQSSDYLDPDVDGYYHVTIRYNNGEVIEIRRVMVNDNIVLDDGDIIRLNDTVTTRLLASIKLNNIEVQSYTKVTVTVSGQDYDGYQYTPTDSPYSIPPDVPRYSSNQMLALKREVRIVSNIDLDAIHWGVKWRSGQYRYFARIVNSREKSSYVTQVYLFATYLNHLHNNSLTRITLANIQRSILP